MSNSHQDHALKPPTRLHFALSFAGILGSFLIFLLILLLAYLPYRPEPVDTQQVEERKTKLADYRDGVAKEVNSYGWVNQSKGVVRIPVEESMKLTVEKYHQAERVVPAK